MIYLLGQSLLYAKQTYSKLQWFKSLKALFLAPVSVQCGLRGPGILSPSGSAIPRILRTSDPSTGNSASGCEVREENESMEGWMGNLSLICETSHDPT